MKSKILALSKNEEFKSLLKNKKISNKYATIFFGILKGLASAFFTIFWTNFLKIGKAAFAPVSYFPKLFGSSKPTYTPITIF